MRNHRLAGLLLACLLVSGAGCKTTPTEFIFDLSRQGDFFSLPYPSDLRLNPAGVPDLAGYPNPLQHPVVSYLLQLASRGEGGWSPSGPIYLHFTGPLAAASLSRDPGDYLSWSAPIQLLDVDPQSPERGRRFPIQVSFNQGWQSFRPSNLLQVLPVQGLHLRESTTYALIVTNTVPVDPTNSLQDSQALQTVLQGRSPGGPLGDRAVQVYAPLVQELNREGIPSSSILAATVFTTGSPTRKLYDLGERLAALPAPVPDPGSLRVKEEQPLYYVLEGTWQVPMYQSGTPPYLSPVDGAFQFDDAGDPVPQAYRTAPFVVTIPKTPMPEGGYPLLFFIHGTGGKSSDVYTAGHTDAGGHQDQGGGPSRIAARRGWASSGTGGHLSIEHLGDAAVHGVLVYNLANPTAFRDNLMELFAEYVLFRRLVQGLAIDPALCPLSNASASPDGKLHISPGLQTLMGHSLGAIVASLVGAADPKDFQGVILAGAGASTLEFPLGPSYPVDVQDLLQKFILLLPGESLDVWHPLLGLLDLGTAEANNVLFLPDYLRLPRPGRVAPHVLVIEGYEDHLIPSILQQAMVAGLGVDHLGDEVVPELPEEQLLPVIELGGRAQVAAPVSGNVEVPGQGPRTAIVIRSLEDGISDGHGVVFQIDAIKHQYGCFLEGLGTQDAPTIVEGGAEADPCPF